MIYFSLLTSNKEIEGPGGLFDINATLPLVAIHFLILMILLNFLLYNPLLKIIEKRRIYILSKLNEATKIVTEANNLSEQYEQNLLDFQRHAKLEIVHSQKIHKQILETELSFSQKSINNLLNNIKTDLFLKKSMSLTNLDEIVQLLYRDIKSQLII